MATPLPSDHVASVFDTLGERWYSASDDPIALLRAESVHRNPWILEELVRAFAGAKVRVLDVGCGGGFLANTLAEHGHCVSGVDRSVSALEVARAHDSTGTVRYEPGDARRLRFPDRSFEVVTAMDFLEHVDDPAQVIAEASRVLVPGGVFVFHTFNRTLAAWLVVIKGVEWFVRNTPPKLHELSRFLTPAELSDMCRARGLAVCALRGQAPRVWSVAFWKMLMTGSVPAEFTFDFTDSLRFGYMGIARRRLSGGLSERRTKRPRRSPEPAYAREAEPARVIRLEAARRHRAVRRPEDGIVR